MSGNAPKLRIKLTLAAAEHAELHAALVEIVDPRQRVGRLKILATKGLIFERSNFATIKRRRRASADEHPPLSVSDAQRNPGSGEACEDPDLPFVGVQRSSRTRDSHRHVDSEPSVLAMLDWEGDGDAT